METIRYSAPGRTEISGNHTDHQRGCVLAAAVHLETTARVTPNDSGLIRVCSEGYAPVEVRLEDLSIHPEERNTTAALVRGMAAGFAARGAKLRGFEAHVASTVLPGSGLSSSAAFEVLLGTILNDLCMGGALSPVEIAILGRQAENRYFGKPCGLMDQLASAVGGMVFIDFENPESPLVEKLPFDFRAAGLRLCMIDSGADHAALTEEYAAIPAELEQVCRCFGKEVLRQIPEEEFLERIPSLRGVVPDRAILRALHFYGENKRVLAQREALRRGDLDRFLALVRQSGRSSWMYLQNVMPAGSVSHQEMALTLALCDRLLEGEGAFRIHGGGFAGTALAFVPEQRFERFQSHMEQTLGAGRVHALQIRQDGAKRL